MTSESTMDVPAAICFNCIHWTHPNSEEFPTCSIPCTGHGIDSYDSCFRFAMRSEWIAPPLSDRSKPVVPLIYAKVVIG